MQARAVDHGRHEATAHGRRRFILAEWDTILSIIATVAIVMVCVGAVLVRGDRPAAAAEPPSSCRRAVDAAERLVAAGEARLVRDGRIDGAMLADPHLTSLYAAWRHELGACKQAGS